MSDMLLRTYVGLRALLVGIVKDESGEGVISTAMAVLIMALLGALMWVAFKAIWGTTSSKTSTEVNRIGS